MPVLGQGQVVKETNRRAFAGGVLPSGVYLASRSQWLILAHKKILLALLFKAVSETILEFGQRRFGGTVGIIAILHTWDQSLRDHFHLHCLVPAGALSLDHRRWINARRNFLFPVKALSRCFVESFSIG